MPRLGWGTWGHFFSSPDSKNLENAAGHRGSARPSHFVVKRKLVQACHFVPTGFWLFLLTCTGNLGLLGWGTSGDDRREGVENPGLAALSAFWGHGSLRGSQKPAGAFGCGRIASTPKAWGWSSAARNSSFCLPSGQGSAATPAFNTPTVKLSRNLRGSLAGFGVPQAHSGGPPGGD